MKSFCQRGALFIEYALILAFVVIAGAIFLSSNGAADSIQSIFAQAEEKLDQAASGGAAKYKTLTPSNDRTKRYQKDNNTKIVELKDRNFKEGELDLTTEPIALAIGDNISIDFNTEDYCPGFQKGVTKDKYVLSYYIAKDNGDGTYTSLIDTSWIQGNDTDKINKYGNLTIANDGVYTVYSDGSTKKQVSTNANDKLVFIADMKDYNAWSNSKADINQDYINQAVGSIKISSGK